MTYYKVTRVVRDTPDCRGKGPHLSSRRFTQETPALAYESKIANDLRCTAIARTAICEGRDCQTFSTIDQRNYTPSEAQS